MRRAHAGAVAISAMAMTLAVGTALAQDPSASPTATGEQPHPAHIHAGTCATIGDIVEPLRDITPPAITSAAPAASLVPDTGRAQVSVTRVDMSIAEMRRGDHAINAHESAAAMGNYIACGDIVGGRGDRNLVIPLVEQNASGFRGVAFLHADGDRTLVQVALFGGVGAGIPVGPGPDASAAPVAPSSAAPIASPSAPASATP